MPETQETNRPADEETWPGLPLEAWADTYATLHMWTQVVGKIRLALAPPVNHWWHVPLYVTPRGLSTSIIPYGARSFEIEFDFIDHRLAIRTNDGVTRALALGPRSVADFYREVKEVLKALGIEVQVWGVPVEVADPIPFADDEVHRSYEPQYANRLWRILLQTDRVLKEFRSDFIGKCSPVHFFWGSFDLAVTRFSGRPAPPREGADTITREAYSHEVISCGFWPGGGEIKGPAFYSYTAPEPAGLREASIQPAAAFYSPALSEFLLMYDEMRQAASPDLALHQFFQSTYEAGANLAGWDRAALERHEGKRRPRS